MGLIKTAMLAGVGIYAVNKISKVAETKAANPRPVEYDPRYERDSSYKYQPGPEQDYPGQQSTLQSREVYDDPRANYQPQQPQQQQQPIYVTKDSTRASPYDHLQNGPSMHSSRESYQDEMYNRNDSRSPPAYSARQQRAGFVVPEEDYAPGRPQKSRDLLKVLVQQGMEYANGQGRSGSKADAKKGQEMLAKLLK